MINRLLEQNDSSFIYLCDFTQMKRYIEEANLDITKLNVLKKIFSEHNRKSYVFEKIIQLKIDKHINDKNKKNGKSQKQFQKQGRTN